MKGSKAVKVWKPIAIRFAELKKHGPMVFIEVYDENEDVTIKVWVE
ncbi:hypothetical protein ES703_85383 [subsurface metagenome]